VRDRGAVRAAMQGCSVVIHAAGVYSFDPADAALMREVNVGGTENVLREAARQGVERIVHTGTVGGTAFFRDRLAVLRDSWTGPWAFASADVAPILGEYERASTAVMNAYIAPVTIGYLERLAARGGEGRGAVDPDIHG